MGGAAIPIFLVVFLSHMYSYTTQNAKIGDLRFRNTHHASRVSADKTALYARPLNERKLGFAVTYVDSDKRTGAVGNSIVLRIH